MVDVDRRSRKICRSADGRADHRLVRIAAMTTPRQAFPAGGPPQPVRKPKAQDGGGGPQCRPTRVSRWGRLTLAFFGSTVCGLAALVAAAAVTSVPLLFLAAGLATFVATNLGFVLLLTRRWPDRQRVRRLGTPASTATGITVFVLTVLVAPGDPAIPPTRAPGQTSVSLPTGSRIAFTRVPAARPVYNEPIIFLHGGPGTPDLAGDTTYFGQLARSGFDVYLYAQVGSGASERLDDPRRYTLYRHVADLEAFRRHIGADKVVLIGHSYGAVLAASYIADHPTHVVKAVYSSPGELDPSAGGAAMVGRLDLASKARAYAYLLRPRDLLAYTLIQVNPEAAHAFADDQDMDGRFDAHYNRVRSALRCNGRTAPELHGLGAYANAYPQSAARASVRDRRLAFARARIPGIVIKGSCDYLSWSSALSYVDALPTPLLVYLRQAGHNAYQDKPSTYLATIRAFLTDRPLPLRLHRGRHAPRDFEGPS
jgi:proline iminopeptidase